jgi:hypothetical protein
MAPRLCRQALDRTAPIRLSWVRLKWSWRAGCGIIGLAEHDQLPELAASTLRIGSRSVKAGSAAV